MKLQQVRRPGQTIQFSSFCETPAASAAQFINVVIRQTFDLTLFFAGIFGTVGMLGSGIIRQESRRKYKNPGHQ